MQKTKTCKDISKDVSENNFCFGNIIEAVKKKKSMNSLEDKVEV